MLGFAVEYHTCVVIQAKAGEKSEVPIIQGSTQPTDFEPYFCPGGRVFYPRYTFPVYGQGSRFKVQGGAFEG